MTLTLTQFRFEIDQDQIAHLIWDMPDKSMNVFTETTLDELDQVVDYIAKTDAIQGCVISSGKVDSFSGGADIDLINKLIDQAQSKSESEITSADTESLITASSYMSRVYRKLETCGKVFAIALKHHQKGISCRSQTWYALRSTSTGKNPDFDFW